MRIKHFAGYGSVEAKKYGKAIDLDGYTILHIGVSGKHECGLVPSWDDVAVRWLLPRFDKEAWKEYPWIDVEVSHEWVSTEAWEDKVEYMFRYKIER